MVECVGSYRRKKPLCGDIDVLIAGEDGKEQEILEELVSKLESQSFLVEQLGKIKEAKTGSRTYMGICKHLGKHRRIDIKVYKKEQFPFAILYFTGSGIFNKTMRQKAKDMGFKLNDAELKQYEGLTYRKALKLYSDDLH